jgi:hypothetical protein
MYSATYDWGNIDTPKLDHDQMREMKQTCQRHCFSTLNHTLAYCYNDKRGHQMVVEAGEERIQQWRAEFRGLATPQVGENTPEMLTPEQRQFVIRSVDEWRRKFPRILMDERTNIAWSILLRLRNNVRLLNCL